MSDKTTTALLDVMAWIKNWDVAFLEDDSGEWQTTEANVQAALKDAGVEQEAIDQARTYVFDPNVEPTI